MINRLTNYFVHINRPSYQLSLDSIEIWQVPLQGESTFYRSLLSEKEVQRANRFHFEIHRRRFIIARGSLRILLGRYLNVPAHTISFQYNAFGKPSVEEAPDLQFNVSHSEDLALIAIGQQYPLGIDLEFFSQRSYLGIAKQVLADIDIQHLTSLNATFLPMHFFQLWSLKEAYSKALGKDLFHAQKPFACITPPPSFLNIKEEYWHLQTFMPKVACCAAICYHSTINKIGYAHFETLNGTN